MPLSTCLYTFFFNAQILAGDQFAVVLCYPFWSYWLFLMLVGVESCLSFELYKNTRIWDCAWCERNEGNNDRDVAIKKKRLFCFYVCVCVCVCTRVCEHSLYLDISHHLSRKHGGQVFFWYSSANVSLGGDSGLVVKTQRADLTCHGALFSSSMGIYTWLNGQSLRQGDDTHIRPVQMKDLSAVWNQRSRRDWGSSLAAKL